MRGYADRAYVHAKICALRSRLLSRGDYRTLLSGGAFDRFFSGLPASSGPADSAGLKEHIFRRSIRGVLALAEALAAYRPLFTAFLRLFEARNAKLLLARALGAAAPSSQWYDIRPYAAFSRDELDMPGGWQALQRRLQGTYLSGLCRFSGRPRFERLESLIDLQCLESFAAAATCLPRGDRPVLRESALMRRALLEVLWQWRLERYYGWPPAQARGHVAAAVRGQVVAVPAPPGSRARLFEQELWRFSASVSSDGSQAGSAGPVFEQYAERRLYGYARSLAAADVHSLACVAGYLWLLYYEIHNLFLVVDGLRFSLPADSLDAMLICEA